MADALGALAAVAGIARTVLLAGGVVFAAVAAADWAVRTRRINPFGGLARFMRARVDPRLAGIERTVVRAGGHPSATPLWGLVAYVVFALLIIGLVDALFNVAREAAIASSFGARGFLSLFVGWIFRFLSLALIVRVVASWFPQLAGSVWVRWSFGATEWMLRPLRNVLPSFGMVDLSPLVAYFALQIAEYLVTPVFSPL